MWWQYLLVFFAAFLTDVSVIPLPPAFIAMIFLQIQFNLNIWAVIGIGVTGSIIGRFLLTIYVSKLSDKIFNPAKSADVIFLGKKLKEKGWKGLLFVTVYSLLPLPTTPLFVAAGMAKIQPFYIIPAFIIGKFTSDTIAVLMGKYAEENAVELIKGAISWKSIVGLAMGLLMIFALFFIDWRTLIKQKKLRLKFNIWSSSI